MKPAVQAGRAHANAADEICDPLQRVVLTLHRNQHAVRRGEGIDGNQFQ